MLVPCSQCGEVVCKDLPPHNEPWCDPCLKAESLRNAKEDLNRNGKRSRPPKYMLNSDQYATHGYGPIVRCGRCGQYAGHHTKVCRDSPGQDDMCRCGHAYASHSYGTMGPCQSRYMLGSPCGCLHYVDDAVPLPDVDFLIADLQELKVIFSTP